MTANANVSSMLEPPVDPLASLGASPAPALEATSPTPGEPCGTNGTVEAAVDGVLDHLAGRGDRDKGTGRFVAGNLANLKSGYRNGVIRSESLREAVEGGKAALTEQVRADLGAGDDCPATMAGMIDAWAECRLLRSMMFRRMVELGGAVTGKGRTRAIYPAYLQALDREQRLAQALGLERKAKALPSKFEALEARRKEAGDTWFK